MTRRSKPTISWPIPWVEPMIILLAVSCLLLLTPEDNYGAHGMVVCRKAKLAFFHIPKTGGIAVNQFLGKEKSWGCLQIGWEISGAYMELPNERRSITADQEVVVNFDSAHVTPAELEFWIFQGVGRLADWHNRKSLHLRKISPHEVVHDWNTFTVVRNPYLRVLGAFAQRKLKLYNNLWGTDYPQDDFTSFMKYLEHNLLKTKLFSWCCSPTITHFRPNTMYTHWENNLPAIKTVLKLEEIDTVLPAFMSRFYNHTETSLAPGNQKAHSKKRRGLCHRTSGCTDDELELLLNSTLHTEETIRITNRLYRRDFDLLGYNMLLQDNDDRRKGEQDDKMPFYYGISTEDMNKRMHLNLTDVNNNDTVKAAAVHIGCDIDLPPEDRMIPWTIVALLLLLLAYRERRRSGSK